MDEKLYNHLLNLLKLFKNRPYHLAKYLIDNKALDSKFLRTISNNKSLSGTEIIPHFNDVSQMNRYFSLLMVDFDPEKESLEDISLKLNRKLDQLIKDELYEDAIRVRDYMNIRNIQRISNK